MPQLYAREIATLQHGLALWHPEPNEHDGPVQVADVGYVRDGAFFRLFNALASTDSALNDRGVPEDFRPIALSPRSVYSTDGALPADVYKTAAVKEVQIQAEVASGLASSQPGAAVGFTCSSRSGAILAIAPGARYNRSEQHRVFRDYMRKNWRSWYFFANDHLGLDLNHGDIIFVYGTYQTASWAIAAFSERDVGGEIVLDGSCLPLTQAQLSLGGRWSRQTPVRHRSGPIGHVPGPMEHTVLLRSFKLVRRLGVPGIIKASAGDCNFTRGSDSEDSSGSMAVIDGDAKNEGQPSATITGHPADAILRYIFEKSNASYAIASDEDESNLTEQCVDMAHPNLTACLQNASPPVVTMDGCAFISIPTNPILPQTSPVTQQLQPSLLMRDISRMIDQNSQGRRSRSQQAPPGYISSYGSTPANQHFPSALVYPSMSVPVVALDAVQIAWPAHAPYDSIARFESHTSSFGVPNTAGIASSPYRIQATPSSVAFPEARNSASYFPPGQYQRTYSSPQPDSFYPASISEAHSASTWNPGAGTPPNQFMPQNWYDLSSQMANNSPMPVGSVRLSEENYGRRLHPAQFNCGYEGCGATFTTERRCRQHMDAHNPNRQKIPCYFEGCEVEFSTEDSLKRHIKTRHSDERPFKCPNCGLAFPRQDAMQSHARRCGA